MNAREFYELARSMRQAQRRYFSTRRLPEGSKWLAESKLLEKRMDDEIARVDGILAERARADARMDRAVAVMVRHGFEVVSDTKS